MVRFEAEGHSFEHSTGASFRRPSWRDGDVEAMSDLERLKSAYKAWNDTKGGSADQWLALMAEEFALRSMDNAASHALTFAKERLSREEAVEYLTALLSDWSLVYWLPETFVSEGNQIAVFGRSAWINIATNRSAEVRVAHLWHFRNGEAIELNEIFDSARFVVAATL